MTNEGTTSTLQRLGLDPSSPFIQQSVKVDLLLPVGLIVSRHGTVLSGKTRGTYLSRRPSTPEDNLKPPSGPSIRL